AFMVWETHYTASARMMVKRFFPKPIAAIAGGYERITRRTFPPLKPNARFYRVPSFYMANHTAVLADGEPMPWPSHTKFLDCGRRARHRRHARLRLRGRAPRSRRRDLHRHVSRLLRPGARSLGRPGPDRRAGDRWHRNGRQHHRPMTEREEPLHRPRQGRQRR